MFQLEDNSFAERKSFAFQYDNVPAHISQCTMLWLIKHDLRKATFNKPSNINLYLWQNFKYFECSLK